MPGDAVSGFPIPDADTTDGHGAFVIPRGPAVSHARVRGIPTRDARCRERPCRRGALHRRDLRRQEPGRDGHPPSPDAASPRGRDGTQSAPSRRQHRRGAQVHQHDVRHLRGAPRDRDARAQKASARGIRQRLGQSGGHQGGSRSRRRSSHGRSGDTHPDRLPGARGATMVRRGAHAGRERPPSKRRAGRGDTAGARDGRTRAARQAPALEIGEGGEEGTVRPAHGTRDVARGEAHRPLARRGGGGR